MLRLIDVLRVNPGSGLIRLDVLAGCTGVPIPATRWAEGYTPSQLPGPLLDGAEDALEGSGDSKAHVAVVGRAPAQCDLLHVNPVVVGSE